MSHQGKLLVARPSLDTSFFRRSVIFICQDTAVGSTGIMLNQILSGLTVDDVMHSPVEHLRNEPLYQGGPVKSQSITLLHNEGWYSDNTININDDLAVSSDEMMLEKLAEGNTPRHWRLSAGICMWSKGQLDAEIAGAAAYSKSSSWVLVDPTIDDIFYSDPDSHWEHAVDRFSSQMVNTYF
jgi:putative transcriptional regulator